MTDDAERFLDADIPDPTDFKENAPGLRQLDEALRCTMCRELFEAPVTVNCPHGHCFCSLCIRGALTTKEECPLCRGQISEVHIRKNPAMEDAVKAWNMARPFVLGILRERAEAETAAASKAKTTQERKNGADKPKPKKRKLNPSPSSDVDVVEVGERLTSSSTAQPSELVPCPACHRVVPMQTINNHLDNGCHSPSASSHPPPSPSKNKGKQKQEWTQLFQGAGSGAGAKKGKGNSRAAELDEHTEPLPKVAYDTVTQKRIREILTEYELSTAGDKNTLAARHSQYVNMFNANLDASPAQRKPVKQLKVEMRRWDEAEEKKKTRKKVDAKDIDPEEYQRENKSAFAKLVQVARAKALPKRHAHPGSSPNIGIPAEGSSPAPPPTTDRSSSRQSSADSYEVMIIEDE